MGSIFCATMITVFKRDRKQHCQKSSAKPPHDTLPYWVSISLPELLVAVTIAYRRREIEASDFWVEKIAHSAPTILDVPRRPLHPSHLGLNEVERENEAWASID